MVRLARPCWPHLSAITFLGLLSTPLSLLVPLPLKIAVDTVIGEQAMPSWIHIWAPHAWYATKASSLMFAAGLLLAIAVLSSVQSLLSWLLQTYTGERLVHDLRAQLLWHAQRLSLAFHDRRGANDTAFRIQYDAPAVQNLLLQGAIPLFTSLFGFFAVLAVTLQISPKLAAISLIISPVLFVLARNSSKKVRSGYDEIRELDSSAMLVLYEALAAVRSVKAFGQESHQDELFRRKSRMRMKEQVRLASVQAAFHVLIGLSIAGATAVVLVIGITQVRQNLITVGELLLVMAYMAQLYEPLRMISTKIPELQASISSLTRATAILDEVPEITETAVPTRRVEGNITMRNVGFQYAAGTRSVLHDVSFDVPAGACVGIIGASGSGKSTLINLITRFYDPSEGQVFLDGIDIRQYDLRDLRRQFSIVLQEPMLFSTTVAGNIAYGDPDANREEVITAAKLANAHDFIENLPQGYDTQIGEKGIRLSGGERQRIAIARAFLKNSPIVILDEPTSAVDLKTESAIMGGIENLAHGRTTFMIAHRLSTLERCDTVLVMKDGRLSMVTNEVEEARRQMLEASRPHIVSTPQGPQTQGPQLVL
jgi:ATP-binding cassette, subfamily B, bacterial